MITFFASDIDDNCFFSIQSKYPIKKGDIKKLTWILKAKYFEQQNEIAGLFRGPRKEMISPWSTNATEIFVSMGILGISRIEVFYRVSTQDKYDSMLEALYDSLTQNIFSTSHSPTPILEIDDIATYNTLEGLSLSNEEVNYLEELSEKINRKLTDSEVFGFAQVNSEHCRHKIFNGRFLIDGQEQENTLFELIKKTTQQHPNTIISAYKDNCSLSEGGTIEGFLPDEANKAAFFKTQEQEVVLTLKAETHNFPTTVEPFSGAATGSGGEIRDRMAGGRGTFPMAGTAVYMTSYPRIARNHRPWEKFSAERKWLYQRPEDILIKASNGASDFGNKFGQPLICGSLLTFEHNENNTQWGYDKVVMLAGGIGYGLKEYALKETPSKGDVLILLGGDNYRIGMGGGAVSSADTGVLKDDIELNAIQRSNPEMQRRAYNTIRALAEHPDNPIISVHDHGAGGHLNCLSELVEDCGGKVFIDKLPIGDKTLSDKEIIGNESQERIGLVVKKEHVAYVKSIADRERTPCYEVGYVTGDMRFTFENVNHEKPIDLSLADMFGNSPTLTIEDTTVASSYRGVEIDKLSITKALEDVLQLEAVACKDWLTNKVDRSVTGLVAWQQCVGPLQLPLNNLGVMALDYTGKQGVATAIGHAPVASLISPSEGAKLAIAKALTNIVWAPLEGQISAISLSANWMWPCNNDGENARLYKAVEAVSEFACELGINIPTGKDSLSMTQQYSDKKVPSPGTLIVSASAKVSDIRSIVSPVLQKETTSTLLYVDMCGSHFSLGGSSLAQTLGYVGEDTLKMGTPKYFKATFNALQQIISEKQLLAGHDVSSGGLITTLLEMCFSDNALGVNIDLTPLDKAPLAQVLFSEKVAVVIQVPNSQLSNVTETLEEANVVYHTIGKVSQNSGAMKLKYHKESHIFNIHEYRDIWYKTSATMDTLQTGIEKANERFSYYKKQPLEFKTSRIIASQKEEKSSYRPKAAIIREKGCQSDRESAYALYKAGFDVKDIHMTDLISGKEDLTDIQFLFFVGGFSNSDVLGSAKGWAGAFKYNKKAEQALNNFFERPNTLSLGVCNGCQLMASLNLIYPEYNEHPNLELNTSGKFESNFVSVDIQPNHSVMFNSLSGMRLGIWVAHKEGRFNLKLAESKYHIPIKYTYDEYPGQPNGSEYDAAAICSHNGRHIAMMPHIERSIFLWQWAHREGINEKDETSPWFLALKNARNWLVKNR